MIENQTVLAVVPARSGSKGIRDKNLQLLQGKTLIAHAAAVLNAPECRWIDRRILSTDSPEYAAEGVRNGLDVPFLRPAELSGDRAGAAETILHAVTEAEAHYKIHFDIVLIVEPTSPLRRPEDIVGTVGLLTRSGADSVVSVSPVDSKFHPHKLLVVGPARELSFYSPAGSTVQYRQALDPLYYRNGACYALRVPALREKRAIITENSRAFVIDRLMINIDAPDELELVRRVASEMPEGVLRAGAKN